MKLSDQYLLKVYNQGWYDCFNTVDNSELYKGKKLKAYNLGWLDYISGDDISSVDAQTNEEILKRIKE